MRNEDLKALNNILTSCNISALTQSEADSFNDIVFETQKDYFDTINSLLERRNESNNAKGRFYEHAKANGFQYNVVERRTDTIWILG